MLGDTRSAAERADATKGSGPALAVDIRSVSEYLSGALDSDHVHVPYENAFRESGEDIKEEFLQASLKDFTTQEHFLFLNAYSSHDLIDCAKAFIIANCYNDCFDHHRNFLLLNTHLQWLLCFLTLIITVSLSLSIANVTHAGDASVEGQAHHHHREAC